MRAKDDADLVFCDDLHERGEEFAPSERVQTRYRLVQLKGVMGLAIRQRQSQLRVAARRKVHRRVDRVQARGSISDARPVCASHVVERGAHMQMRGDSEIWVDGVSCATNPIRPSCSGSTRLFVEDAQRASTWRQDPTARCNKLSYPRR